jgi:hypothetical protein
LRKLGGSIRGNRAKVTKLDDSAGQSHAVCKLMLGAGENELKLDFADALGLEEWEAQKREQELAVLQAAREKAEAEANAEKERQLKLVAAEKAAKDPFAKLGRGRFLNEVVPENENGRESTQTSAHLENMNLELKVLQEERKQRAELRKNKKKGE